MRNDTFFRIGGCAGSFPPPSEVRLMYDTTSRWGMRREPFRRVLFGTRTTSYLLRHEQTLIVIDNGLGVEPISEFIVDLLADEGLEGAVIHLVQTHYHDDHIQGIHANSLLFEKNLTLRFYSPDLRPWLSSGDYADDSDPMMRHVLREKFREFLWPVTLGMLDEVGATREHVAFAPGDTLTIDKVTVRTMPLDHPGGACGLRFEIPGTAVIVVTTDYEPPATPDPAVIDFYNGANLVLTDMQYRDDEYEGTRPIGRLALPRVGWGHGTPSRVLPPLLACPRRPQRVRVVHHDPRRDDMQLRVFCEEAIQELERMGGAESFDFEFARDGDVFWF